MADVVIDGNGGTEVVEFDGNPKSLKAYDYLDQDMTALGQTLVPASGRELIVGPGGGVDILQAVRRGRTDVTAVEINPLMVQVVNHELRELSGAPYELPGVKVIVENGRTFIKRTSEKWNLINLTWVDNGGSAQAMAFSEYYLYTVEAYSEFFTHLSDDGMFAFMRALGVLPEDNPSDTMRGVSVAAEALRRRGESDPSQHVIVGTVSSPFFYLRPMCYVLVKVSAFTPNEVEAARAFFARYGFDPLWLPGGLRPDEPHDEVFRRYSNLIRDMLTSKDPHSFERESWLDVAASTDDRPFYFINLPGPHRAAGRSFLRLEDCLWVLLSLVVPFFWDSTPAQATEP